MDNLKLIAKTLPGLEPVLVQELEALGAKEIEIVNSAVLFNGDQAVLYKANLWCRTALKILKPIKLFPAESPDDVFKAVKEIDWEVYLSPKGTYHIEPVIRGHEFDRGSLVPHRIKDGITEYFRKKSNTKPSVRLTNPDLVINIHINEGQATISLDSTGVSLGKRGWRQGSTEAQLNEVLAAGLLMMSGWQGDSNLYDPMCGTGTILIEAALIALNIPPGIFRDGFAFERWNDFNEELYREIYDDDSQEREFNYLLYGSDVSSSVISIAGENVKSAGLNKYVSLSVKSFQNWSPKNDRGVIFTYPPHGEKILPSEQANLYSVFGRHIKQTCAGHKLNLFIPDTEMVMNIGIRPQNTIKIKNGLLPFELQMCDIRDGMTLSARREGKNEHFTQRGNESTQFGEKKVIRKIGLRANHSNKPTFRKRDDTKD